MMDKKSNMFSKLAVIRRTLPTMTMSKPLLSSNPLSCSDSCPVGCAQPDLLRQDHRPPILLAGAGILLHPLQTICANRVLMYNSKEGPNLTKVRFFQQ